MDAVLREPIPEELPPDAVHYAGKDVKLGTPNRPVLWMAPPKLRGRCVVIYADPSVQEIPADRVPKLPESKDSPESAAKEPEE